MAERKQFLLRINPELWEELNRWAAQEFRSVNGQIEFLLRRAVDERRRENRRKGGSRSDETGSGPPGPGIHPGSEPA